VLLREDEQTHVSRRYCTSSRISTAHCGRWSTAL